MGHVSAPATRLQVASSTYATSGLSVIPIGSLKTKAPRLESWVEYTKEAAREAEAVGWFTANGHPAAPALGIVCGAVSGGLTVIDFDTLPDGETLFDEWAALVEQLTPGLIDRLPSVITPSGGRHIYLRCDVVEGNTKLAQSHRNHTWIETRGEGGYVLAPPSEGYYPVHGRVSQTPTVTQAERALLLNAARSLTAKTPPPPRLPGDTSPLPGDAYNARATIDSVAALMIKHGWTLVAQQAEKASLRRPGKEHGISATIRLCSGVAITYAFSANAAPLPTAEGLSPFAVYTYLEHGGDYSSAARSLGVPVVATPAQAAPAQASPQLLPLKRLKDLLARDLPDLPFAVPGIIPDGLFLLAGAPKTGKSLMCLGMALGIAQGGYALGTVKVEQRPVIYYVLEDGERLFRKRALRMLDQIGCPDNFYYRDEFPRLDQGALEQIGADMRAVPNAVLFVDTFQRIRPRGSQGLDAYQNDANGLEPLAKWVIANGATCVLVHHTTKQQAGDFLVDVSGSFGLSGTAGAIGVLKRTRQERELRLLLSGRAYDEDQELLIEYDPATQQHTLLGNAEDVGASHIERLIIESLRFNQEPMPPRELLAANPDVSIDGIKKALARLLASGRVLQTKHGYYTLADQDCGGESAHRAHRAVDIPPVDNSEKVIHRQTCVGHDGHDGHDEPDVDDQPQPTLDDGRYMGIPKDVQRTPCAGCGKRWSKRYGDWPDGLARCVHCGVECRAT
jgi:AAA domain-containing protein/bifunctional DNA primase/polymerase-like protein